MSEFTIRRAELGDLPALNALMHASSAYAGEYARILEGYDVTEAQIASDVVVLAERLGVVAGFYSLVTAPQPELDLMFVADAAQGSGLGRALFAHMRAEALARGIGEVKIISHPPALPFYERMGAIRVGESPPHGKATWARPILKLDTSRSDARRETRHS